MRGVIPLRGNGVRDQTKQPSFIEQSIREDDAKQLLIRVSPGHGAGCSSVAERPGRDQVAEEVPDDGAS